MGERWPPEAGVENWRVRWERGKAGATWGTELIMVPGTAGVPLRIIPRQAGRPGTEPRAALGIADSATLSRGLLPGFYTCVFKKSRLPCSLESQARQTPQPHPASSDSKSVYMTVHHRVTEGAQIIRKFHCVGGMRGVLRPTQRELSPVCGTLSCHLCEPGQPSSFRARRAPSPPRRFLSILFCTHRSSFVSQRLRFRPCPTGWHLLLLPSILEGSAQGFPYLASPSSSQGAEPKVDL